MNSYKNPPIQVHHTKDALEDMSKDIKSDISSAIKRWKNKQNENNFNKTFKSSVENEPRMKQYECIKDETIKGKLFSLEADKFIIGISTLLFSTPINTPSPGIPVGTAWAPIKNSVQTQPTNYAYQTNDDVDLYYYSWNSGNIGIKSSRNYQQIKIPANECVIATGRKLISSIKDANLEELYEVLTTKGTGFIKRNNLCLENSK